MLQRRICDNGVTLYESPLLVAAGVPHAFSTRIGGVSDGPFASLNLGNPNGQPVQDPLPNIAENYRLLQSAIGCGHRSRWYTHQVHGAAVLTGPASADGDCELGKADAMVSTDAAVVLSVRVADCVPVLLADRSGRRVAAVHAGWRGVIVGAVLAALRYFDDPSNVIAAIGPSISFAAFEVGPEVLSEFERVFGRDAPLRRLVSGKGHIDLRAALAMQITGAGVPTAQIESTDRCTVRDESEFFSHRRSGGLTGRMAALIGAAA